MRFSMLGHWPTIAKENWKIILLILIICGVLCGGYKGFSAYSSMKSGDSNNTDYQKEMDEYQKEISLIDDIDALIKDNIASQQSTISNNPIMRLDPFNCQYEQISVVLSSGEDYQVLPINSWIAEADAKTIFETTDESVLAYKKDLLTVVTEPIRGANLNGVSQFATEVRVYDSDLYDYKVAANNLKQFFQQDAKKDNIGVERVLISSGGPYSQDLYEQQELLRKDYLTMKDDSKKLQEYKRVLPQPAAPVSISGSAVIKTAIKYGIMGVVIGIIICAFLIWYIIRYGGFVLNKEQMRDLFDLEYLGEYNAEDPSSNRLIDANLKATKANSILFLSEASFDQLSSMINGLDSGKSYHIGHNIIDDVDAIDQMADAEGIVVGVSFGKTRIEDIQRTVSRASHLGKENVGYVVL